MRDPLQPFGFKDSAYERVDQPWTCGRAADGDPCPLGPDRKGTCRGAAECVPARETGDDGRPYWRCTRLRRLGGPCTVGPDEQGRCSHPRPPCHPVASVRARRGRAVLLTVALAVGVLALLLFARGGSHLFSPGPLSLAHAGAAARCADCHRAAAAGPAGWLAHAVAADGAARDAGGCLGCHRFGNAAFLFEPHTLPPAELAERTRAAGTPDPSPAAVRVARWLSPGLPERGGVLACSVCHHEHRGRDARLADVDDATCHACHARRFESFAVGHPDFGAYPGGRRKPIAFDHQSHFMQHFKQEEDRNCANCHVLGPDGATMPVRGYDHACARCHEKDVAGSPMVFLQLPKLDPEDFGLEGWADKKSGENAIKPSAYLRALLGDARQAFDDDPDFQETIKFRGKQGKSASAAPIAAAIQRAFRELGDPATARAGLADRLEKLGLARPGEAELDRLLDPRLVAAIGEASRRWFAGGEAGEKVEPKPGSFSVSDEEWSVAYLPQGHADPILTAWLPVALAYSDTVVGDVKKVFNESGKFCFKCHNVDREGDRLVVRWDGRLPRRLAMFTHAPHLGWLSLQADRDWPGQNCANCHTFDETKETKQGFFFAGGGVTETATDASNFRPVRRATCATCHNGHEESDSCLTCHRYHAGERRLVPPEARGR